MECPVCKKTFQSETGRRPKKFCSDACKVKYWNAQKRVAENNKPENKKKIEDERNNPPASVGKPTHSLPNDLSDFEKQFQELKNKNK